MTYSKEKVALSLSIPIGSPVTFVRWHLTPDGYKAESKDGFFDGLRSRMFVFTTDQSGIKHRLPVSEWTVTIP